MIPYSDKIIAKDPFPTQLILPFLVFSIIRRKEKQKQKLMLGN